MRIVFKVLERSKYYPLDDSNEKLEMTLEMLLKIFAQESQFYKGVMKM